MTGTEGIGDIAVVLAALVLVANQQGNRRSRGFSFKNTGQNLDGIRLAALRHMARRPRFAAVEFGLNISLAQRQTRWAAINHAADCRPV